MELPNEAGFKEQFKMGIGDKATEMFGEGIPELGAQAAGGPTANGGH